MKRTDRTMIRRALDTAIENDKHLLECLGPDDPHSENTAKDIAAYRRVLARHFGSDETASEGQYKKLKPISVYDIINKPQKEPRE